MRRISRAFTLIELLVVIGTVAILMALLLPSLASARNQAGYVRWQAFQRGQANDQDLIGCWPMNNDDYMTINLTNIAAGSSADADGLKGTIAYGYVNRLTAYKSMWIKGSTSNGAVSRWNIKPALQFSAATNIYVGFETLAQQRIAQVLSNTNQVTISFWLFDPVGDLLPLRWQDTALNSRLEFRFQGNFLGANCGDGGTSGMWSDSVNNAPISNYYDRLYQTFPVSGQTRTLWQNWVFTKDATQGSGGQISKLYYNGALMVLQPNGKSGILRSSASPCLLDTTPWTGTPWGRPSLMLGGVVSGTGILTLDDMTIYGRVLSDGEVAAIYNAGRWQ